MRSVVLAAAVLVGCGSSVETMLDEASASVAGSGGGAIVGSSAVVGSGGSAVASVGSSVSSTIVGVGAGGAGVSGSGGSTGVGGDGGAGVAACVDPEPTWTCHPGGEYYTPACNDVLPMPAPCGAEWCPDFMRVHCRQECMLWDVNMATGECHVAGQLGGPLMCGPGGNTWGCQGMANPQWSCCVEGGA